MRLDLQRMNQGQRTFAFMVAGAFTLATGVLAAGVFVQPGADALWQVICSSSGLAPRAAPAGPGIDFTSLTFVANVFVTAT